MWVLLFPRPWLFPWEEWTFGSWKLIGLKDDVYINYNSVVNPRKHRQTLTKAEQNEINDIEVYNIAEG